MSGSIYAFILLNRLKLSKIEAYLLAIVEKFQLIYLNWLLEPQIKTFDKSQSKYKFMIIQ